MHESNAARKHEAISKPGKNLRPKKYVGWSRLDIPDDSTSDKAHFVLRSVDPGKIDAEFLVVYQVQAAKSEANTLDALSLVLIPSTSPNATIAYTASPLAA
jgi:hypothetical protein